MSDGTQPILGKKDIYTAMESWPYYIVSNIEIPADRKIAKVRAGVHKDKATFTLIQIELFDSENNLIGSAGKETSDLLWKEVIIPANEILIGFAANGTQTIVGLALVTAENC